MFSLLPVKARRPCFLAPSAIALCAWLWHAAPAMAQDSLFPGAQPLTWEGDLSARMVDGIHRFLDRETAASVSGRAAFWKRDFSSDAAYEKSVEPNRERLRRYIGAADARLPVTAIEFVSDTQVPARIAETEKYEVFAVRWPVLEGVFGEGLYVRQKGKAAAKIVALPDADQTPEMILGLASGLAEESQFARKLAESGCELLVPVLVNRQDTWSGHPAARFTNQPHREWIYRQAFEMGRHIIGYEVQKVLAAVDWLEGHPNGSGDIGVAGYGEGGLVALYSAAVDTRLRAAWVSGYFQPREQLHEEPIYRNVFGLLQEFGDAELAALVAPRRLAIEHSRAPEIDGPPARSSARGGAAPGRLSTPAFAAVEGEARRAKDLLAADPRYAAAVVLAKSGSGSPLPFGSDASLQSFLDGFRARLNPGEKPLRPLASVDATERQRRAVKQLEDHAQKLLRDSERVRDRFFWERYKSVTPATLAATNAPFKKYLWQEVIGRFPKAEGPLNPRLRKIHDEPLWTGYEVVLDVWEDVFAWGYLLVPKGIAAGEKRPVVVCQHGLEGVPADTINGAGRDGHVYYKAFTARLAERGFVTYAPHNPYRGETRFRQLQRKLNPLKKSLYSVILEQHDRTLDFLSELPFADPKRIGFYGLSYGGKTAMRVPPLLERYALSICSADFNDWIRKNVTVDSRYSYMFVHEYELPEFNLGHTFNYAEMAALIAPRPFMVERGHDDNVAPDEWVAYEYAKVKRFYDRIGLGDRTEMEVFNGPHTINGEGTFRFLHRHLQWLEPK